MMGVNRMWLGDGQNGFFFPDRKWNSCYPCALGFVTDPPRISKSRIRKPSPKPRLNRLFTMFAVLLYIDSVPRRQPCKWTQPSEAKTTCSVSLGLHQVITVGRC